MTGATSVPTTEINAHELAPGHVMVGGHGGLLLVCGEVEPSTAAPGQVMVEVGPGVVHLPDDLLVEVLLEPYRLEPEGPGTEECSTWVPAPELAEPDAPGVLTWTDGSRSRIVGDAQPSPRVPGTLEVHTEHGTMHLDLDVMVRVCQD